MISEEFVLFWDAPRGGTQSTNNVNSCRLCNSNFSFFNRRHHCRKCGGVFCDECTQSRLRLKGINDPVRVCDRCSEMMLTSGVPEAKNEASNKQIIREWVDLIQQSDHDRKTKQLLKVKVYAGIPNCARVVIWPLLADSIFKQKNPGVYEMLLKLPSKSEKEIVSDIGRTFPEHSHFSNSVGQGELYNVLKAHSNMNPEMGYCQGMSFFGAILLMHMKEEDAFWLFSQLMKTYNLSGLFQQQAPLLEQVLTHFSMLVAKFLPKLEAHFKKLSVIIELFSNRWFCTLFSYDLPFPVVFRIWDIWILEGFDIIFKIGLAILKLLEELLLVRNARDTLDMLKNLPTSLFERESLVVETALSSFELEFTPFRQ